MKTCIPAILWMMAVYLLSLPCLAQSARPDPEPFAFSSTTANHSESKDVTMLRNAYRQFMQAVASTKTYNFNQIRSASHILIGSTEEESLQNLVETSRIIRKELLEKLPQDFLLAELKNYNPPVAASRQGMILGLKKDLDLYRAQMANSRE